MRRTLCSSALVALSLGLLSFSVWAASAESPIKQVLKLEGAAPVKAVSSNEVKGLKLTADQKVNTNKRVAIVKATTSGPIKWIVNNLNPQSQIETIELTSSKSLMIFLSGQPDTVIVYGYTVVDGLPSDPVRSVVVVESDEPEPEPEPEPGPGPGPKPPAPTPAPAPKAVKGPIHVSLVLDFTNQTPELAAIINDSNLQTWLADNGYKRHVLSLTSDSVTKGGLSTGVTKAGGAPALVIQDGDGNILDAAKVVDAASIKILVSKYKAQP